jgi:hypothetical protein
MSLPRLHRVETKSEFSAFIALPRRLYAAEPHYVAPLDHDRRQLLDPKLSAFHTHGETAYWLARRGRETVGRISAQIDHLAGGPMHEGVGFFGCLDAIDDVEVVGALLREAEGWLANRGKRLSRGPFLLSINGESGLLIAGQDKPAMVMMPWHPAYLAGLVERCGYGLAKTMNSYAFDRRGSDLAARLKALGMERRRAGYVVRDMNMRCLEADAEQGRLLFNASWAANWGFVPVSQAEMTAMVRAFRPLLRADYGVFVEKAGETIGFALFLPNLYEIVSDLGGAPSPLGWLKLGWRAWRGRFSGGRGVLFGVAARLVGSVSGASVALILVDELMRRAEKTGVQDLECGWILDDNYAMTSVVQWLGAKWTRRFGVFETTIQSAHPTA